MENENENENENEKNLTLPHESQSASAEPSNMENQNMNKKKKLTLPREVIVEILLRLPVRSLRRLKKVSPSWSSIISDPHFAKSHFDLNAAPTDRLLLRFLNEDRDRVQSFYLDSSLHDRSAVRVLNVPLPSISCDHNPLYFFGSCRGFMLLGYEDTGDVIVWNPTTRFDREIQDFEFDCMSGGLHGFGYDKSTDDYFIVLLTLIRTDQAEIQGFSLKSESWHDAKSVDGRYMDLGDDSRTGVFLNDSIHWLVASRDTNVHVVIAFDLVEKSLSEIPLSPNLAAKLTGKVYYLRVMGECLSLCSSGGGGTRDSAEIWVMKKYKVQSSWTKAFVITSCHIPCRHFYPVCFVEGGGVVGTDGSGTLMKFSSEGELLEHRKYDQEYKKVTKYFEMYRESLLLFPGEQLPILCATSLPGDFKEAAKEVPGDFNDAIKEDKEKATSLPGEFKEATKEEKEKATSLPGDFKEATEEEEEKTIEDEQAKEDEYATVDEYASGDEEEEATDDSNASEGDYSTEDEEDATEEEEEGETDGDGETDDDDDGGDDDDRDSDSDDRMMMEKMKMTYKKK